MTVSAILTRQHSQRRVANEAIGGKGEGPVVGWLLEGVMREEDDGLKGACRDALHGWGLGSGLGLTTTLRDELAVVIQRGARYDAPFPVGGGVHEWGKQSGISHSMYDWVYESFEAAWYANFAMAKVSYFVFTLGEESFYCTNRQSSGARR